jgi:hypothetical protein
MGVIIVLYDFGENYAFILQCKAQVFNWNNDQASLHPYEIYFRKSSVDEMSHSSLIITITITIIIIIIIIVLHMTLVLFISFRNN